MRFMYDDALAHITADVQRFLDVTHPQQWTGREGPVIWPACSPNLNPLDFRGDIKLLVIMSPHNRRR